MTDARRRRKAKQARRDARRNRQRDETPEEVPLADAIREAVDSGDPMELLGLAATLIEFATPRNPLRQPDPDEDDDEPLELDVLIGAFIGVKTPETTALLTVLGEILIYDDEVRELCRREVAARDDELPQWLAGLAQIGIERVVRMTHVLGDGDELIIGTRLADGQALTCVVFVDHNFYSFVTDAFFVPDTVEQLIELANQTNDDPDITFVEMDPADARAWIEHGIDEDDDFLIQDTDTWPACRPLVLWLAGLLPEGGALYEAPNSSPEDSAALLDKFFASLVGMPFADADHRLLLQWCIDENISDPNRWSAARLDRMLEWPIGVGPYRGSTDAALAVPDLLRAFVPFAHAQSGIRDELTAEALAAIGEAEADYRESVRDALED